MAASIKVSTALPNMHRAIIPFPSIIREEEEEGEVEEEEKEEEGWRKREKEGAQEEMEPE